MAKVWTEPNFSGPSPYLPPPEVLTYDPHKSGRIETPLDKRGLTDRRALMFLMRETVVPEYDWTSPAMRRQTSNHHLQWPKAWYERNEFRNRGSNRTNIRPIAHNHVHNLTLPPPAPSAEVEYHFMEAQDYADEMKTIAGYPRFIGRETLRIYKEVYPELAGETLRLLRRDISEDVRLDLDAQFDAFSEVFEKAKEAPTEFQIIDYSQFELRNTDDMMKIARMIIKKAADDATMDQLILDGHIKKSAA